MYSSLHDLFLACQEKFFSKQAHRKYNQASSAAKVSFSRLFHVDISGWSEFQKIFLETLGKSGYNGPPDRRNDPAKFLCMLAYVSVSHEFLHTA